MRRARSAATAAPIRSGRHEIAPSPSPATTPSCAVAAAAFSTSALACATKAWRRATPTTIHGTRSRRRGCRSRARRAVSVPRAGRSPAASATRPCATRTSRWQPRFAGGACFDASGGAARRGSAPAATWTSAAARAARWASRGLSAGTSAAALARRFTDELHVGDVLTAPFAPGGFDVVTAFHVLEHVPDPVAAARRMLDWLAPGGLLIVEVPNAGGLGASLFQDAWAGLELPRHLSHFTPATLEAVIEKAGGAVIWTWHQAKPRTYLWSLSAWLSDRGWSALARATELRPVYGALKLGLELLVPLARLARRGEAIRIGAVRNRPT